MKTFLKLLPLLLTSMLSAEIIEKSVAVKTEGISVTHIYRDEVKILDVVSPVAPPESANAKNRTYTIIVDSVPLYRYGISKIDRSFVRVNLRKMDHVVKLHASKEGLAEKVIVSRADGKKIIESFHIKDSQLISFSDQELTDYREMKDEKK